MSKSTAQQLADTTQQLADTTQQLEAARAELLELRRQHTIERIHLIHELEQLRGRMVHRLTDNIDMLEVGLTALRNKTPRIPVMAERAERVVYALRAEVQAMKEA